MIIKDMFQKNIERDIRGVIKVAQTDEDNIYQELDEYVVTRELNKHLSKFYENYQKGIDGVTDKMGVWISGFFGSGKSHFLKILAYLIENKQVKKKNAIGFFQDKLQDPLILANMNRTADVETETILFNIESKASLDSKSKEDAILRVFMKVFYEHRGYYGDIPGVAEMEKYLDEKGVFNEFQVEFKVLSGEEWIDRRNTFYFDADYVIGALTKVTDMSEESARNWFENGVNNFEISIEKFAKDVKSYIDQKGKNFHLVFLVDEIGQFIGDSRSLMLNLQTVAEDLGTYCQGKVWIMVTSQESIDSIVKVKGDDFSRIQGRFDTRLSLSSISVDEVIKKRILLKKEFVNDKLKLIFPEKSAILKNLISFKESTADLRGYDNEQEFADVYPFIPYQFKLLQNVFEQVRRHGSSGKHLSEGERSMLSAFKEAGLCYKDEEEGMLIPFYAFYDTIKEFLNPSISRVIEGAYENPALKDDEFNMNLLKVLFMIKYVKELPANIDNIATLMVTNIDEDKLELKEKIKISLRKLIAQTLVQKNGGYYIFLTDDEQDINREINSINVDEDLIKREIANYIFQDLYDEKKYRYSSEYSFSYNQKMDEKNYGNQTSSIGVNILSPLSDHYVKSVQELMLMSSGAHELLIKLGSNESYIEEMEEVLKIEEYRKKKNIIQLPESIQNILNNKQAEVRERRRRVKEMLEDAIKGGKFFINGDEANIKGSTVKEKINTAMSTLVENVYIKLGYVKDFLDNERELSSLLHTKQQQMNLDEDMGQNPNELALKEIMDFINLQDSIQKQIRVEILTSRFNEKPYGWRLLDIQRLIVELLKDQKIRLRYNSEYLEPEDDANKIVTVLTKSSEANKGIIIKRKVVDPELIRVAKKVCKEVFNKTDLPDDEDGLVKEIRLLIEKQVNEIESYKTRYEGRKYPGMSLLNKGLKYFGEFHKGVDNASFFAKMKELQKDLSYWEEDMAYLKSFFNTDQKGIFDKGISAISKHEENRTYLIGEKAEEDARQLKEILDNPIPYGKIKFIPEIINKMESSIQAVLDEKREKAKEKIKLAYDHLSLLARQYGVSGHTKEQIEQYYAQLEDQLDSFTDIYKVDATISQSDSFKERYEGIISQEIADWKKRQKPEVIIDGGGEVEPPVQKEKIRASELVGVKILRSEGDVDQYINTLSNKLKQIIKSNKEIEFID
ncbi:BREX system P-loop protein BrxC [Bacillus cereus group sp. Bc222]|uniref:BREX system P-loop protein BrxC n=1 Tax=Bacillus cereus group TaxID=86661 RepID=UPI000941FA48|nr:MULTISPECIES: BREX system P-loop protein BrxC [Bacillus cereus group]MBL3741559.1 BREX system P-loop protein BrxC [Bacillus cereus]MBL3864210.1 BREX system P-loop protein BrxC [Bacillus cereus]MDA2241618.1 BREX system P-loop protein BrxC [Bacillus cereus group sp. Bc222]HDR8321574.1 BREX system P-loop protein BrxC [Bacillus cereus]HDR8328391.1 BREX system P-loop protein BrxC [Bacillus cereus]